MTGKSDFSPEEWDVVLGGPPSAGLLVAVAQRGGTFRESLSMAKAYAEARRRHGESQLLDEITSTKPEIDHTRFKSADELRRQMLDNIRDAVATVERKAGAGEAEEFRKFVVDLSERVAEAHREGFLGLSGEPVGDAEREALVKVREAVAPATDERPGPAESTESN